MCVCVGGGPAGGVFLDNIALSKNNLQEKKKFLHFDSQKFQPFCLRYSPQNFIQVNYINLFFKKFIRQNLFFFHTPTDEIASGNFFQKRKITKSCDKKKLNFELHCSLIMIKIILGQLSSRQLSRNHFRSSTH